MKNLLTLIGLFIFCNLKAQSFDSILGAKLQSTLDSLQTTLNIRGISASAIIPMKGKWNGASGVSHLEVPIDTNMIFHIASNTKTFTAVSFLKLVENEQAQLEDSLHQWLPNYNSNIDSNITIKQLLNHTSGIANTFDIPGFSDSLSTDWNRIFTPQEILSWLPGPIFTAGTGQSYSNPNYNLTGLVIESATDQSNEQIIRDTILDPLNLNNTFFPIQDTINGIIAHPWLNGVDLINQPRTSLLTANWASGAMYSTASDMTKWYNSIMNGNFLNNNEKVEMTTFVGPQNRGIGIQQVNIAGIDAYGHGGGTIGYGSIMLYDPNTKIVLCVLVNDGNANQFLVAEKLLSEILKCETTSTNSSKLVNEVKVYPNPGRDRIKIQTDLKYDELSFEIFDLSGRMVESQQNSKSIDASALNPGNYFIKIILDQEVLMKKIIIVK